MKSTVTQIAREAGVSPATVDRVLNNRDGVRARTRDIVLEVARSLGYFGPQAARRSAVIRLDFVMPAGDNTFMSGLKRRLVEAVEQRDDVTVKLHVIEGFNPDKLAAKLMELADSTDGVGIVALDHPTVREAVNHLADKGIKIATLVSDIHNVSSVGYIGIDNRAAGRLAGQIIGRFMNAQSQCNVAVFAGSLAYRGHEEREMGFRHILSEDFPNLHITRLLEVQDDRQRAYEEARRVLAEENIAGIYNIGSGNQGIARALTESGRHKEIVFIGHDFTEPTKALLLDGTMDALIDQNPRVEAREVIRLLVSEIRDIPEPEYLPRLQIVFRENIPLE